MIAQGNPVLPTGATIDQINPCSDVRWTELQRHGGSLFTSEPWLRAVASTYGLEPLARILTDATGTPLAGLAFCELDDPLGRRRVSFPFSDFHGPVGDLEYAGVVLDSFDDDLPTRLRIPADRLPRHDKDCYPTVDTTLLHHTIDVSHELTPEQIFASLKPAVRQNIRKSQRAGVSVELRRDLGAIRTFYDLHVGVRAGKYRLLPQPFEFFRALHEAFEATNQIVVALAELEGRAIAGVLYIESGATLYYKFNASASDELSVRPNEQLLLAGMELCLERGLHSIDLGVSDTDQPGLIRYKRKFAQREQDVITLRSAAPVDDSAILRETLGQLTELLTDPRVPRSVAEDAGALLYRYFA